MNLNLNLNLNLNQVIAIILGIASAVSAGAATAYLTTIIGAHDTSQVIAVCGLIAMGGSIILAVTTGQANIIKQVAAMPGIDPLQANANANVTVATLALDKTQSKITIAPGAEAAVQRAAQG